MLLIGVFNWILPQQIFSQLAINPNGFITIQAGGSLYVGTDLHIHSNSTGSGHLADQNMNGDVDITGNISIERYIQGNGWHNAASPVTGTNTNIYTGTDLTFYYDETKVLNDWNFGWVWYQGVMSPFKGYDVYLDGSAITVDYTASNSSGLNTGAYSIAITRTDVANGETENHKGWNLVGNPYPSPVSWLVTNGWDKSDINDAKYIWNPAADNYTIFLGGGSPIGINGGTRYIPSNQGFWVQATTNGTFSINNTCRRGLMSATPDYYKSANFPYPLISLIAEGNSLDDETVVRFIDGSTSRFDLNLDAVKLGSSGERVPQISTRFRQLEYAVNSLPEITDNLVIPLDFWCASDGNYCIKLGERTNLLPETKIYLLDNFTKEVTNLGAEGKYCFTHEVFNSKERFSIVFNPTENKLLALKTESSFLVYAEQKTIFVSALTETNTNIDVVVVLNLMGQTILRKSLVNGGNIFKLNSAAGYYVVRVISGNESFNKLVFIH